MTWWGKVRRFFRAPAVLFDSTPRPIDQLFLEMTSGATAKVSRTDALSVPAVQRGRNMICAISTLPLVEKDARNEVVRNPLLEQFDRDVANVVTLAQTIEDLLFESIAWWRVTLFDSNLFPYKIQHLDVATVSVDPPIGRSPAPLPSGIDPRDKVIWVDGKPVPADEIIRFDSPNPAVLKVGARAIRRAILLDAAASMYADDPRPLDYFTPAPGADPISDDDVQVELAKWKAMRKKRSTGWIPASMQYNSINTPSPQQLQLVELQKKVSLDIANALGIDPEDLGVSTTSRTYANVIDRRQDKINEVYAPYMRAITDRLSMGDVTPPGHRVVFELADYMKSNPTERWTTYKIAKEIDVLSPEEIRAKEGEKPGAPKPAPAPVPPAPEPDEDDAPTDADEVDASTMAGYAFADDRPLQFIDVPVAGFNVDRQRRIIEGLALPYGSVASKYGLKFRFLPNSLKWTSVNRVKLMRDHDTTNPIGVAQQLTNVDAGVRTRFKVAKGIDGDRALELADPECPVLDGLSVGVDFDMENDVEMDDDGVMNIRRAMLREVSLTAMPAFDDARVTKVAASRVDANPNGGKRMDECATCGQRHAPGAACPTAPPNNETQGQSSGLTLSADQLTTILAQPGALQALVGVQQQTQQPARPRNDGSLTLSAEQVASMIRNGQLGALLGVPQLTPAVPVDGGGSEGRQPVDPTRRTGALSASVVREELPYRFDRKGNLTKGRYDFSTDLVDASKGDGEAHSRALRFVTEQFAEMDAKQAAQFDVDTADVTALNPNRQRPDLYVDQKEFQYPVWSAIEKGTLADSTPFVLPKFNTASGLVATHTQGTEPTPGAFTATSQTVTPTASSGKVEVTREAWDAGGNPQLSGIIWRQMIRAWFEALEAAGVAMLDALTPTGFTLTTAAVGTALTGELEGHLAGLHFVRGGFRMRDFILQVDLYKRLADAKDADGRKVYPVLGPSNVTGTTEPFFGALNIAGLVGKPAWALAASGAVAASSYLFDRNDVHGWASAPNRLQFEYRVAYVDVAIWGYKVAACTDVTGVREIIYDPTV